MDFNLGATLALLTTLALGTILALAIILALGAKVTLAIILAFDTLLIFALGDTLALPATLAGILAFGATLGRRTFLGVVVIVLGLRSSPRGVIEIFLDGPPERLNGSGISSIIISVGRDCLLTLSFVRDILLKIIPLVSSTATKYELSFLL